MQAVVDAKKIPLEVRIANSLSNSKILFSIKSFVAGIFALYTAFSLDLERPFWALVSVYIISQPLAGAVRSKAFYRICGSFIGAAVTVFFLPNFVNEPLLLSVVLSLWISVCLYLSVLDRTPRSYIFLLAGYTAGIIGFPSVNTPGDIFNIAVTRFEEITLGIIFATIMHSLVFPLSVASVFRQRLNGWWENIKNLEPEAFAKNSNNEFITHWQGLATEISQLYILSTHLTFEASNLGNTNVISALDERMSLLLATLYIIADRFSAIPDAESEELARVVPEIKADSTWVDILKFSISVNLNRLIALYNECIELQNYLFSYSKVAPNRLETETSYKLTRPLHRMHTLALLSAMATFFSLMLISIFWIATAWPDGGTATQLCAIASCFFASQIKPVSFILRFMYALIINIPIGAFYLFVVLPRVDGFFMLMLVLAPFYLITGYMMMTARWGLLGIASILALTNLILLQEQYTADFAIYLNISIALFIGIGFAALFNYLFRTIGNEWFVRKLSSAIQDDLCVVATKNKPANIAAFTMRTEDRLGLLASPPINSLDNRINVQQGIKNLDIGINIISLKQAMLVLPENTTKFIRQLLDYLSAYYQAVDNKKELSSQLLSVIDYALTEMTATMRTAASDNALLSLCGLRRNLFPEAPPYVPFDKPFTERIIL